MFQATPQQAYLTFLMQVLDRFKSSNYYNNSVVEHLLWSLWLFFFLLFFFFYLLKSQKMFLGFLIQMHNLLLQLFAILLDGHGSSASLQ